MKQILLTLLSSLILLQSTLTQAADVNRGRRILFLQTQIKELTEQATDIEVKQATMLHHATDRGVYIILGSSLIITPVTSVAFNYVVFKYLYRQEYLTRKNWINRTAKDAKRYHENEIERKARMGYGGRYPEQAFNTEAYIESRKSYFSSEEIMKDKGYRLKSTAKNFSIAGGIISQAGILLAAKLYNSNITRFQDEIHDMDASQLEEKYGKLCDQLETVKTQIDQAKEELNQFETLKR